MADEARALANEAHEQSSEHLQVILDHIKDVVLTVDEDGVIQTFNPTGERVFGHMEPEVVGQRVDLLIPKIATPHESVTQALHRLAASSGDTALDLASRESWGQRKDGEFFPAEMAVSKAPSARREVFVLCLRDITERRQSEQAMRESEARYRLLVNHAPEAIVVFDVDAQRFVDANENAERFFGLDRARLLHVGPVDLSPPFQPDGTPSAQRAREYVQRAFGR
jgi:PAS domain S-box-containing protein